MPKLIRLVFCEREKNIYHVEMMMASLERHTMNEMLNSTKTHLLVK